jgi:hypothetical protein
MTFWMVRAGAHGEQEQTSYDDLLDALRLSLKGYNIE